MQVTARGGRPAKPGDTAAALALRDLVGAVDTSVEHPAAAMGRPVWVLSPFHADWRWTAAAGSASWY